MSRRRQQGDFTIARDLGPSDAPAARDALSDWLAARVKRDRLDLAPGDAPPSPLALQLLVAATRSRIHTDIAIGADAGAALTALGVAVKAEA